MSPSRLREGTLGQSLQRDWEPTLVVVIEPIADERAGDPEQQGRYVAETFDPIRCWCKPS
jgi:hypothetical protein